MSNHKNDTKNIKRKNIYADTYAIVSTKPSWSLMKTSGQENRAFINNKLKIT